MAFQDTLPLPLEVLLPVIAAIASFSVAAAYTGWVAKQKPGTKEMLEISYAVGFSRLIPPASGICGLRVRGDRVLHRWAATFGAPH